MFLAYLRLSADLTTAALVLGGISRVLLFVSGVVVAMLAFACGPVAKADGAAEPKQVSAARLSFVNRCSGQRRAR